MVVAVSTVAGARILSAEQTSVPVLVAAQDVAVGASFADIETRTVQVDVTDDVAATLIGAGAEVDAAAVFGRALSAGELVPRAALTDTEGTGLVQVPISVDPDQVPPSVRSGSVIDVYVRARDTDAQRSAGPVLAEASVVSAPQTDSALIASGKRQLVVAVAEAAARRFVAELGASDQATITVVRRH